MDFAGDIETHLTIRLEDGQSVESLRAAPSARGLKLTHIVLARGVAPSQPMLTRTARGTLSEKLAEATALRDALEADGFGVSRIKVEAAPWNEGVPATDDEAAAHPPGRYFEHHAKLLLDGGDDLGALAALAQRHSAHLSHNALRRRDDGRHERFVTQRRHGIGRETARRALDALLGELESQGYEVIDVEQEFVVHDSDLALDAGWIEPAEAPAGAPGEVTP